MNPATRGKVDREIDTAPCARRDEGNCSGRITVQHCFGRLHQETWKQIYLCHNHHQGAFPDKQKDTWIALNQATDEELKKYPKSEYIKMRDNLNKIYGNGKRNEGIRYHTGRGAFTAH